MIGARFVLHIKLRFSESSPKLPANFIEDFSDKDLERSLLQNWKTNIIAAKEWEDNHTSFMIAVLIRSYKNVAFDHIRNSLKVALSSTWTLKYNNHLYKLLPTFNKHVAYNEATAVSTSTVATLTPVLGEYSLDSLKKNPQFVMLKRDWEYWKQDMRIHGNAMDITKLSFCSLIELESSEYTRNTELITLTSSNRTLGLGEFLTVVGQDGETRPRVCVEELYPPDNTGPGNDCSCGIFAFVAVHAACTLLL